MLRRGSLLSRMLAAGLLGALLLAGYGMLVAPVVTAYSETGRSIEQSQILLQRYRALADQRPQLSERLAELEQRAAQAGGYLEGSSDALAAAELQDRVRAVIERAGGTPRSTQILPANAIDATAPLRRAALRIQLAISIRGLQAVLYELETGQPYLFINELSIRQHQTRRRRDAPPEEPALEVSFEVFGYVRAAES